VNATDLALELETIRNTTERTLALFRLFDSFVVADAWGLTLVEKDAAEPLKTWAQSRGFAIRETQFVGDHRAPYANLQVSIGNHDITILGYRNLTDQEAVEVEADVRIRRSEERVGSRVVLL
jgi:hypothetical protein